MNNGKIPLWLLGIAITVRLVVFLPVLQNPSLVVKPDSLDYIQLARNVWAHHAFSLDYEPPFRPDTFRTAGYPLFLIPFVTTFQNPVVPIALAQTLLGLGTVLLAWSWLKTLGGRRPAQWGTLLLAIDPVIVLHTPYILSETLFYFILVLVARYTWELLHTENAKEAVRTGLLWGLSAFIRPVTLYLPMALAILPERHRIKRWFLVSAYIIPCLWVFRNIRSSHFLSYTSMSGIHLLRCFASGGEALRTHRSYNEVNRELEGAVNARYPDGYTSDIEQSRAYAAAARPLLKAHPGYVFEYCLWGTVKTLGGNGLDMVTELFLSESASKATAIDAPQATGRGTMGLLKRTPILIPFLVGYMAGLLLLYIIFILSMIRLWKSGRWREAFYLVGTPLYFLLVTNHAGYYRHRISMMPFLAAGLVLWLKDFDREKDSGRGVSS